ncbi:transcriptional regulator [Flavobacterium lutivivi]|nr:transcriptional regulator [Flavobacterium lutivivi]HRG18196.1 sensor of ECF-type sigma factor [Flavobacterium lutivivi]
MKNKLTTLIILLITMQFSFAQNGKLFREKREQIKSIKVAYITNELSLTPEESAKFWPLYNAFEEKQQEIRKQKLKGYLDRIDDESFDNLSEKEATAMLTQMENTEDELYQLRKKFIANLKSVLPASKILKLKKAEEGFNRKLLQQYRDKRLGR